MQETEELTNILSYPIVLIISTRFFISPQMYKKKRSAKKLGKFILN